MKLLACAPEMGATIADIRLAMPLHEVARRSGWTLDLRDQLDVDDASLAAADVLVVQRPLSRRALSLLRRMRASGGAAVCDLDDLLTEPAPHLQAHAQLLRQLPTLRLALAEADIVSAATPRLAAALAPLCRDVRLVPNHAWPDAPQAPPWTADGAVHLLLASSDRLTDCGLVEAIAQLLRERPGRLALVAVGPAAQPLLAAGLPVRALPLLSRPDFLALAASLPQGAAAIPLGPSRFDSCKSAIKWFDYGAAGLPVLCSKVPPYADVVVDGHSGRLVADGADAWLAALRELLDEPQRAQAWARSARAQIATDHTLAHTTLAWTTLLSELGERSGPARAPARWQQVWGGGLQRLQRWNRTRLARRAAVRAAAGRSQRDTD